jgi:hypothetical protein
MAALPGRSVAPTSFMSSASRTKRTIELPIRPATPVTTVRIMLEPPVGGQKSAEG